MYNVYSQAFTEVLEVLKNSEKSIISKIPNRFIEFLNKYKDKNYIVKIDFSDENWDDKIKKETQAILALIYRDYIVSPKERERLLIEEIEEQKRIENEISEKYNFDNLFKDKIVNNINNTNNVEIVKYKGSIFKRLINKIKSLFMQK